MNNTDWKDVASLNGNSLFMRSWKRPMTPKNPTAGKKPLGIALSQRNNQKQNKDSHKILILSPLAPLMKCNPFCDKLSYPQGWTLRGEAISFFWNLGAGGEGRNPFYYIDLYLNMEFSTHLIFLINL